MRDDDFDWCADDDEPAEEAWRESLQGDDAPEPDAWRASLSEDRIESPKPELDPAERPSSPWRHRFRGPEGIQCHRCGEPAEVDDGSGPQPLAFWSLLDDEFLCSSCRRLTLTIARVRAERLRRECPALYERFFPRSA